MDFLQLHDVIFNHPFPMLIAVFIVYGMISTGAWLAELLFDSNVTTRDKILGFVVTVVFVSVFTNMMASLGLLSVWITRFVAILLVFVGIYKLPSQLIHLKITTISYWHSFKKISTIERFGFLMVFAIIIGLFLACLGPPSDADSLDYHLGVPLDWLRNSGSYPRPDWFHARLIGLGESINLFGLQCGTDILGHVIQFSGLFVIWAALSHFVSGSRIHLLLALLIFTVPVNLFLVTTQKPMLFPAAALVFGFVTVLNNVAKFDRVRYIFGIICIVFAVACKYSFLISGSIFIFGVLWLAYLHGHFKTTIVIILFTSVIIALPIYIRNFLFYGDPFSPLFEHLKLEPDPALIAWIQDTKKTFNSQTIPMTLLFLPFKLGLTLQPGLISTVLGIGVFGFIFIRNVHAHSAKIMLTIAGLITIGLVFAGLSDFSRYYLEAYWLLIGSIVTISWKPIIKWFRNLLFFQAGVMVVLSFLTAYIMFPGSFTDGTRKEVLGNIAYNYSLSRWIDAELPMDAVVLANMRSNALMPRKFISWESGFRFRDKTSMEISRLIDLDQVTAVLLNLPFDSKWDWIKACSDTSLGKTQTFFMETRNPLNKGAPYQIQLFFINKDNPDCLLNETTSE